MKQKVENQKSKGLFDHLNALFANSRSYFKNLTDTERKTFSSYMINRFLSMHPDIIELVNVFQQYTPDLTAEDSFKFYFDILPKKRMYLKYIKSAKEEKYHPDLIRLLTEHYQISSGDAIVYLRIYYTNDKLKMQLVQLLQSYGYDLKQIQDIMK